MPRPPWGSTHLVGVRARVSNPNPNPNPNPHLTLTLTPAVGQHSLEAAAELVTAVRAVGMPVAHPAAV